MKSYTIVESNPRGLYIVVERDDGSTFGREIPEAALSAPSILRSSLDGEGNPVLTVVLWEQATEAERKQYVNDRIEAIATEADFRQQERPIAHLIAEKIGQKQDARAKKG